MYFNHDKFVSVNKVPTEYDEIKELIENHKNAMEDTLSKLWKYILSFVRKKLESKILEAEELNKIDYCLYQTTIFSKTILCLNYI